MSPISKQAYLNHVNGLRAIAILAVVLYHLRAAYCPTGYFGVDVFLVISGFFLFRKLMEPQAPTTFHYGNYLLHKAWRLLPSWFLVTLCVGIVAFFCLVDAPAHEGFRAARNSAYLLADFRIDHSGDYFNPGAQENPLLHIWYLSIICQLYLIAPLLVIPLTRRGLRKPAHILLATLALLSLVYWILTTTPGLLHPDAKQALLRATASRNSYYHLIPRLWEIIAGYSIVFMPALHMHPRLRSLLGIAGLVGVILSCFLFETSSPFSYSTVLAAMLVIKYGDSGPAARILSLKPIQFLGGVSFSLYLWHWPVMAVYKYLSFGRICAWDEAAMLLISLVLGWLAWRYVEKGVAMPMGGSGAPRRTAKQYAVLLCLPVILCLACWGRNANTRISLTRLANYFSENRTTMPDFPAMDFSPLHAGDAALLEGFPLGVFAREPRYLGGDSSLPPTYLLVGDSHAQHLDPGIDREFSRIGRRGISLNNSVLPIWGHVPAGADRGDAKWDKARAEGLISYLQAHPSIRCVIISLYWDKRLFLNSGQDWDTGKLIQGCDRLRFLRKGLVETCRRIAALGVAVVLVADTPAFGKPAPFDIWKRKLKLGLALPPTSYISHSSFRDANAGAQRFLEGVLEESGAAALINPALPLLDLSEHGCPDRLNGNFIYFDCDHLTSEGSYIVGEYIVQQLLKLEVP